MKKRIVSLLLVLCLILAPIAVYGACSHKNTAWKTFGYSGHQKVCMSCGKAITSVQTHNWAYYINSMDQHEYRCTICNQLSSSGKHTWKNGKCTVCGCPSVHNRWTWYKNGVRINP